MCRVSIGDIRNNEDITVFMEMVNFFHDSCIKERHYVSGAYVNEELSMYPINDKRTCRVIIQRQSSDRSMIELQFKGLKYLKLFPVDEQYTSEILDATMILKKDCIYWCDCGGLSEKDLDYYEGTLICAEKLEWRTVDDGMGQREFFKPIM